jgi:hypothetical protein
MSQNLVSLRSIAGVEGSFHFDSTMALLERDLASFYTDEFIAMWQAPIIQAFQASDQYIGRFEDLLFSYPERQIYIRRHEQHFLCVIALTDCDLTGLRMGARLLIAELAKPVVKFVPPAKVFQPPQAGIFNPSWPTARPAAPPAPPRTSAPPRTPASRPQPPGKSEGIWG